MTSAIDQKPSALKIAKCLVKIAADEQKKLAEEGKGDPFLPDIVGENVTPLKLQKLLYFAQAAHLATKGEILFKDDIVAYKLGPVVYLVFKEYEGLKGSPIPVEETACNDIDADTQEFLRAVWQQFGKYTASELVEITHRHQPWITAFKKPHGQQVISVDEMREFYKPMFVSSHDKTAVQA